MEDSSASRTPPLMDIVEASVPASERFNDPAVNVIPPERLLPDTIATGVMLATVRDVTVESASTSRPKLSDVVLTLSNEIELRRSLLQQEHAARIVKSKSSADQGSAST